MVQFLDWRGDVLRNLFVFLILLSVGLGADPLVFETESPQDSVRTVRQTMLLSGRSQSPLYAAWWRPAEATWQMAFKASSENTEWLEVSFLTVRRRFPLQPQPTLYLIEAPWRPEWGDGPVSFRCSGAGAVVLSELTFLRVAETLETPPGLPLDADLEATPQMPLAAFWLRLQQDISLGPVPEYARVAVEAMQRHRQAATHGANGKLDWAFTRKATGVELSLVNLTSGRIEVVPADLVRELKASEPVTLKAWEYRTLHWP